MGNPSRLKTAKGAPVVSPLLLRVLSLMYHKLNVEFVITYNLKKSTRRKMK